MGRCFIILHPEFDRRYDEGGGERAIVDLLVEQIECADILVLNKMDQVDAEQKVALREVTAALNRAAACMAVEHAKCEVRDILRPVAAGSDEGLPSLSPSNLLYTENPYSYTKCH